MLLVKLYEVIESDRHVYLVMEFAANGEHFNDPIINALDTYLLFSYNISFYEAVFIPSSRFHLSLPRSVLNYHSARFLYLHA